MTFALICPWHSSFPDPDSPAWSLLSRFTLPADGSGMLTLQWFCSSASVRVLLIPALPCFLNPDIPSAYTQLDNILIVPHATVFLGSPHSFPLSVPSIDCITALSSTVLSSTRPSVGFLFTNQNLPCDHHPHLHLTAIYLTAIYSLGQSGWILRSGKDWEEGGVRWKLMALDHRWLFVDGETCQWSEHWLQIASVFISLPSCLLGLSCNGVPLTDTIPENW